jgi:formiminotetrahydrofolate cyclodeaminase
MGNWANEIKNVEGGKEKGRRSEVRDAMIAANNHYAGFGPGTVNIFRNMVGLSELSWEDQQQIQEQIQQQKQQEKDQLINNSDNFFSKRTIKRQSSLTEFTG